MTLSCQARYLFVQLSAIIFFCYSHQLLHGLETPKVLIYRNHLCAKQNPGLDLYTNAFLCYDEDDGRILPELSPLKTFCTNFRGIRILSISIVCQTVRCPPLIPGPLTISSTFWYANLRLSWLMFLPLWYSPYCSKRRNSVL